MSDKKFDILIVGVGGQGVLLASEILSDVALRAGLDVKKSEVHGMSQRGGVVSSHIRINTEVFSPTIPKGRADIMLSFEQAEAVRAVDWMKPKAIAIVADTTLVPAVVTSTKGMKYPENLDTKLKDFLAKVITVEADKIANELGNPRLVNTILLGILSNHLPFKLELWQEVIKDRVKEKFVEINLAAFDRGRNLSEGSISSGEAACQT